MRYICLLLLLCSCVKPEPPIVAYRAKARTADVPAIAVGLPEQCYENGVQYTCHPPMRRVTAHPAVIEALRFSPPWPQTKWVAGDVIDEAVRRGVPPAEILPDLMSDTWYTIFVDPQGRIQAVAWSER